MKKRPLALFHNTQKNANDNEASKCDIAYSVCNNNHASRSETQQTHAQQGDSAISSEDPVFMSLGQTSSYLVFLAAAQIGPQPFVLAAADAYTCLECLRGLQRKKASP